MHLRIAFLASIVTLFMVQCLNAQHIKGQILDQSGNPVVGANVILEGAGQGTSTGTAGEFELTLVPSSSALKISSIGFVSLSIPLDEIDENEKLMIQLRENLYQLPEIIIERQTMTGGLANVSSIPGSAHYFNLKQLNKFSYTDPNRLFRNIPGLNIQEEDGFGLRPNIGMRGTGVERSSKITLMEDGILMAPAPYTAPSAYYFPTMGRMQGVEVRKGSSQIKYGPYTTGGAINLLSTAIPSEFASRITLLGGNYGRRTLHAMVGQSFENGGFMLETFQNNSTGFKELDNGGPTGFTNEDYLAKIRINTSSHAKVYQAITFKIGQTIGNSDETYLGLTQGDFDINPNRRYFGSQLDQITTEHRQYSINYSIIPTNFMDVSVTAYRNDFSRNWYKLDKVKYDMGSAVGISDILDDPFQYANEYGIITGNTSPNADALYVKANNRNYYGQGIQFITGFNFNKGFSSHDVEVGLRIHSDEEDRFQWEDTYEMENGVMKLNTSGTHGTDSNRITDADAVAAYLQYTLQFSQLKLLPGVRYEKISLSRVDYGKTDPLRTGSNISAASNSIDVWIPGVSAEFTFNSRWLGFVGVHRGFSPPGPTEGTLPESSINYEAGARYTLSGLHIQSVGFFNDYDNLLGADLASSGGGGTGDLFNAGKARIYGVEAEVSYRLPLSFNELSFLISSAYTYTNGSFLSSFNATNEDWGTVENGDHLPYLSTHQLTLNAGIEHSHFDIQLSSKFNGEMRTIPGQGNIPDDEKINSNFIVDLSTNYRINHYLTAFGSVSNLFNDVYVVAHRPAGLRPGLPRSFMLGIKMNF